MESGIARDSWESRLDKGDKGQGCLLLLDRQQQQPGTSANCFNSVLGKRSARIRCKDNDDMNSDYKEDSGRESDTSTPDVSFIDRHRTFFASLHNNL